jgi:uncharacterized membrane protein (DUF106 family)
MKKEKVTMLKFICGVLVGGIIGVVLMCLLQIYKMLVEVSMKDKKKAERRYQEYLKKMNKKKGEQKK